MLKDHYRTLGLPPSATQAEIKKAYRRLARELHPDKTQGDPYAREKFFAVKEAYETLIHPVKKQEYLQQRWYQQATGQKMTTTIQTPETMLQQALDLERHIRNLDHYRMDRAGLAADMAKWLNDEQIEKLNSFHDNKANEHLVEAILRCMEPLTGEQEKPLLQALQKLESTPRALQAIVDFEKRRKVQHRWDRHKPWLMLLLVALICLLIFFVAR